MLEPNTVKVCLHTIAQNSLSKHTKWANLFAYLNQKVGQPVEPKANWIWIIFPTKNKPVSSIVFLTPQLKPIQNIWPQIIHILHSNDYSAKIRYGNYWDHGCLSHLRSGRCGSGKRMGGSPTGRTAACSSCRCGAPAQPRLRRWPPSPGDGRVRPTGRWERGEVGPARAAHERAAWPCLASRNLGVGSSRIGRRRLCSSD